MNINVRSEESAVTIRSMFRHIPALRTYARQSVIVGEPLAAQQVEDKSDRMREYLETGESLNWTKKELVVLLLRDVFALR